MSPLCSHTLRLKDSKHRKTQKGIERTTQWTEKMVERDTWQQTANPTTRREGKVREEEIDVAVPLPANCQQGGQKSQHHVVIEGRSGLEASRAEAEYLSNWSWHGLRPQSLRASGPSLLM